MNPFRHTLRRQLDVVTGGLVFLTGLVCLSLSVSGNSSRSQLVCVVIGLLLFLAGVLLFRREVTRRLKRMVDIIDQIRRTGRPVKLPVGRADELGTVAAGFNQLIEQVEEQKHRLREHIVELQRVNAEFDQLANLKDDFLATVNHQLRTPLTTVIEGISLLHDGAMGSLNSEQHQLLGLMEEHAKQLVDLVDSMLDLSMMKSGRRPLNRQPGDLAVVLQRTQQMWAQEAKPRTVRLLVSGTLPSVYMDAQAIQDVMNHLMRNALRHTPEASDVLIRAQAHDRLVEIAVEDHGAGLSAEQMAQLFQPFVHLQTPEAPGSQGNGLGLALCRQVIERHRGSIRVSSAQGMGTTITFTLPVTSLLFLFEEACRMAQEESEYEREQFGVCLAAPLYPESSAEELTETMRRAVTILRKHTHRGDRFVELEDRTVAIVAIADDVGLAMMMRRLRSLVERMELKVRLVGVVFPIDGTTPQRLLEVARHRLAHQTEELTHAPGAPSNGSALRSFALPPRSP